MTETNNAEALDRGDGGAVVDSGAGDGVKLAATGAGVVSGLCGLDPDAMLSLPALAGALGVCSKTVERAIKRRELPPGVRLGGRRVWLAGRVRSWITSRAEAAEKDTVREIARLRSL